MSTAVIPAGRRSEPGARAQLWWELGCWVSVLVLSVFVGLLAAWVWLLLAQRSGIPLTADRRSSVMITTTELVWIVLVLLRAWSACGRELVAELGAGPMRRLWLLALAIAAELAFFGYNLTSALHSPLCGLGLHAEMTPAILAVSRETPGWFALFVFALVILAPASEELMFRGWLWSALRGRWGPWPTALVTGGLFWLMHAAYGWTNLLMVLPLAIAVTVLRHFTGSIRGTVALHALHNAGAVALTLVLVRVC